MKHKKIIVSVSIVLFLALASTALITFKNINSNRKSVEIWHQVVLASNKVGGFASNNVSDSNTNDLLSATVDMNSKLDDAKFNTDKLGYILVGSNRKNDMTQAIDKVKLYNNQLKTTVDSLNSRTSESADYSSESLESLNKEMKASISKMLDQLKFKENLSDNYYKSFSYPDNLNQKLNDAKTEAQKEQQAADAQTAAIKNSKNAVEGFLGDYIRKDFAGMKSNMTNGFQSEFKFSEIESGWANSHPKSYRILEAQKSGESYIISANLTYLSVYPDIDGVNVERENTTTEKYRVTKDSSGAYLVDGQIYY
jgi:hypothetical protein